MKQPSKEFARLVILIGIIGLVVELLGILFVPSMQIRLIFVGLIFTTIPGILRSWRILDNH